MAPERQDNVEEKSSDIYYDVFMVMKAQGPITAGQEVTISYIDPTEGIACVSRRIYNSDQWT